MLDGELGDVDLACLEANLGVAQIVEPHTPEAFVEPEALNRRPRL